MDWSEVHAVYVTDFRMSQNEDSVDSSNSNFWMLFGAERERQNKKHTHGIPTSLCARTYAATRTAVACVPTSVGQLSSVTSKPGCSWDDVYVPALSCGASWLVGRSLAHIRLAIYRPAAGSPCKYLLSGRASSRNCGHDNSRGINDTAGHN